MEGKSILNRNMSEIAQVLDKKKMYQNSFKKVDTDVWKAIFALLAKNG